MYRLCWALWCVDCTVHYPLGCLQWSRLGMCYRWSICVVLCITRAESRRYAGPYCCFSLHDCGKHIANMYNIVLHIMQLGYAAVMCVELCTLLEPLLTCCPPPPSSLQGLHPQGALCHQHLDTNGRELERQVRGCSHDVTWVCELQPASLSMWRADYVSFS